MMKKGMPGAFNRVANELGNHESLRVLSVKDSTILTGSGSPLTRLQEIFSGIEQKSAHHPTANSGLSNILTQAL